MNNERIMKFQLQLAKETWEPACIYNDTTSKGNSFVRTFLNIFEASFLVKYKSIHTNKIGWITQGIKISRERKRIYIYIHTHRRDNDDAMMKAFYIKYKKVLIKLYRRLKQHYT
jgi:hypothetical protein